MRNRAVAVTWVVAVASLVVLLAVGILAPAQVAAQTRREEPRECVEAGPASPRCTAARDKQMKERLQPRACEKYGAGSPKCERALQKRAPKRMPKAADATPSSPASA